MSTAKIRAINKYNRNNTKCVLLRLNLYTDKDILDKLDSVPSKSGYLKTLVRKDISNSIEKGEGNATAHVQKEKPMC